MLKISNVETFYGKIQALRGVNIDINKGEIVSLIGSNGAGKSTLLMTISGVNKAKTGEIIFEGKNIAKYEPHDIVDLGIAQAPEGRRIFSRLTVEENLRLGAHANEKGKFFDIDVKDIYDLFPVLSDRKSQRGGTLSGGEQQRVCIARAIVKNPEIILADEPTGNLDPTAAHKILKILEQINKEGTSVIMATHNYKLIAEKDYRIIELKNGRLISG